MLLHPRKLLSAFCAMLFVIGFICVNHLISSRSPKPAANEAARPQILELYKNLPLGFEFNNGQLPDQVDVLSRGNGYNLSLAPTKAMLSLNRKHKAALRMELIGGNNDAIAEGIDELPGRSNYFIGNNPKDWTLNVKQYAKMRYRDAYPGIDLVYYGNQRQLEYDFIVHPGASPDLIKLDMEGADSIKLESNGDLALLVDGEEIRKRKPAVYQETDGVKAAVACNYVLQGDRQVGFQVADYDKSRPLIIDPVINYGTFLGGSGNDEGLGIAAGADGAVYITGDAASNDFPTNSLQKSFGGGRFDAFIAKIDIKANKLVYSTYLGGSGDEFGFRIAVDAAGNAVAAGFTSSTNFPVANAFQAVLGGGLDVFAAKLNSAGNALLFSTYLGGAGADQAFGLALDSSSNVYLSGTTGSTNFPAANPLQGDNNGKKDCFIAELSAQGNKLLYSSYLGGSGDDIANGIALDAAGNLYLTGSTSSGNFPTASPLQASNRGGGNDVFIAKLKAGGGSLVYSTYLGGAGDDQGADIVVDAGGNALVTGLTSSQNFPLANAAQKTYGGGVIDTFVAKLNSAGSALVYSTYLGGSSQDQGFALAVDGAGNAYVAGLTNSSDFPSKTEAGSIRPAAAGGFDNTVSLYDVTGNLISSFTFGGGGNDSPHGIIVDQTGNIYITGGGSSLDLGTPFNGVQPKNAGGFDGFLIFINPIIVTPPPCTSISLKFRASNSGDDPNNLIYPLRNSFMGIGSEFTADFDVSGGTPPYSYSITSSGPTDVSSGTRGSDGGVRAILSLNKEGVYKIKLTAVDSTPPPVGPCMGSIEFQVTVTPLKLTFNEKVSLIDQRIKVALIKIKETNQINNLSGLGPEDTIYKTIYLDLLSDTSDLAGTVLTAEELTGDELAKKLIGAVIELTIKPDCSLTADEENELKAKIEAQVNQVIDQALSDRGNASRSYRFRNSGEGLISGNADENTANLGNFSIVTASGIRVYLGDDNGGFRPPIDYQIPNTQFVIANNFTRDTIPDIVTGSSGPDGGIRILTGLKDFSFSAPALGGGPVPSTYSTVRAADLNGDGDLDLALGSSSPNLISVFLGNGKGGFASGAAFPLDGAPRDIGKADLNGDGNVDIVSAGDQSNNITVLLGDGKGGFSSVKPFPAGLPINSVVIQDFDLDGNFDIAGKGAASNVIVILFGMGNGNFSRPLTLDMPPTAGSLSNLAVIDPLNSGKPGLMAIASSVDRGAMAALLVNTTDDPLPPNFDLTLTPAIQDLKPGDTVNYTIKVAGLNGFAKPVKLTANLFPATNEINLSLPQSSVDPGNSVTLGVTATAGVPTDRFNIVIKAMDGSVTKTFLARLNIAPPAAAPDFALVFNPAQITASRGQKGQITAAVNRTDGFDGNVTVTAPDTKAIKVKITPPSQATAGASATFSFKVKPTAPLGSHQLIFSGRDDSGRVRTAALTLTIQ